MNNLKTVFLSFFLLSATLGHAQTFKINGTIEGLADDTKIYVRLATPEKLIDSTLLKDGKFSLSGKMDEKITRLILYTEKFSNYVVFFAEEQPITMTLKAGEFKKGTITGSKTQLESNHLSDLTAVNQKQQDSLQAKFKLTKDTRLLADLTKLRDEEKLIYMNYVKDNPNSLISANLLSIYSSTWGKEKTSELYKALSPQMKNTPFGKSVNDYLNVNKEIKIGGHFVDFEQPNINGKNVKLSDIKAKYVLLEFWASWCGPCRADNPGLVKTYNEYKGKGFEVLGVSLDDSKSNWLKAVKDDGLIWENISDLKGDKNNAALIYGLNAVPTNYLIDEKGTIIAKNLRGADLTKKLKELLP